MGPRSLSHCSNREVPELVIDPFPPKNRYCFPDCLLFCVLKTWLGFLPTGTCKCQFLLLQTAKCQIVSPVSMTVQKCDCAQFVASILPTALWRDCLSLFSFGYCIVRPLKMAVFCCLYISCSTSACFTYTLLIRLTVLGTCLRPQLKIVPIKGPVRGVPF